MTILMIELILFLTFYIFVSIDSQEHDNCTAFTLIEAGFSVYDRNKGQICCPLIGCFANQSPDDQHQKIDNRSTSVNKNDSYDPYWKFWQHIARLPYCPDGIGLQFHCFSNWDSSERFKVIDYENLDRDGPKLAWQKNKRETAIIIHGWKTDWPSPWMYKMRDAFLGVGKRVVLVRWSNGSNIDDYAQGAVNTRVVGASVAHFVQRMIAFGKLDFDYLIIVGFSLGAQAAGLAAKKLPGLKQLVGLDPAGPLFACQNSEARIDVSDAKRVLIFHTNGKNPLLGGRGTMQQLGHLDFYVNGGKEQPDCDKNGVVPKKYIDILSIDVKSLWSTMSCSHQRAPAIYSEIIQKSAKFSSNSNAGLADPKFACSFLAFPCNSSKQWTTGQCFETCEIRAKSTACLRPAYVLDDIMFKQKLPEKYFFDLRSDGAAQNDSEFCGRPFRVALNVSKEVTGTIKANFVAKAGRIDNVTLLDRSGKLNPESSNSSSRVVILPWTMTLRNLQYLDLNYVPDRSLWAKIVNDKKDFILRNLTIMDLSENKLQSCGDQIITMTKINRVTLKTKC